MTEHYKKKHISILLFAADSTRAGYEQQPWING